MAIRQKLLNLDASYKSTTGDKIILNDLNFYNIDDIENINDSLMTVYDNEVISTVPTCDCGNFKGRYLLDKTCPSCSTTVKDPYKNNDPLIWLRKFKDMPKFVNPHFWLMLKNVMAKNMDCVRWICDTSYNPPVEIPQYLHGIADLLGDRSYTNFIKNIDKILVYLMNHPKFKTRTTLPVLKELKVLYETDRAVVYSNYLPIVNKKLFVMENTNMGKFTNLAVSELIDLVMMWIKATSDDNITVRRKNNITAAVISKLTILYAKYFKDYISSKPGIFRKHIYGSRSHFTFRSVIVSIAGRHQYDEIHVPWAIGVTAFRPHIMNKLVKRGYTYKQSNKLLFKVVKVYDPVIHEILDEIINECPLHKIPVIMQRNPSLLAGSAVKVFITKFKTDVEDKTTGISILSVKSMNADFDGDELNYTILLDELMAKEMDNFEYHYNIPDISKPFSVSGNLALMSPATSIISNYIYKDVPSDEDTISKQLASVMVG